MKHILATLISILLLTLTISAQEYDLHGNLIVSDTTTTNDMNITNDIYIGSLKDVTKNPIWSNSLVLRDPATGKLESSTFLKWYDNVYPVSADCVNEKPYWAYSSANELHIGSQCTNGVRLGVGTDSPDAGLDVSGTGRFTEEVGIGILPVDQISLLVKADNGDIGICVDANNIVNSDYGLQILNDDPLFKAIAITDDNASVDNFYVTGTGDMFGRKLKLETVPGNWVDMIQVKKHDTGEKLFKVISNGTIFGKKLEMSGDVGNPTDILIVTNEDNNDLMFNVLSDGSVFGKNLEIEGESTFSGKMGIGSAHDPDVRLVVKPTHNEDVGFCVDARDVAANKYGVKVVTSNDNHKSFAISDDATTLDNFVVWGDGRVDASGLKLQTMNSSDKVFSINNPSLNTNTNTGDVFRVLGNGEVWATTVTVKLQNEFPDYVFDEDYELMPLNELKTYISENNKLPNMPSAESVTQNGVNLGEMDRLLTEKVEELTLYILQLKKEVDDLKQANQFLQNSIQK